VTKINQKCIEITATEKSTEVIAIFITNSTKIIIVIVIMLKKISVILIRDMIIKSAANNSNKISLSFYRMRSKSRPKLNNPLFLIFIHWSHWNILFRCSYQKKNDMLSSYYPTGPTFFMPENFPVWQLFHTFF
jgi:hypothetical protein